MKLFIYLFFFNDGNRGIKPVFVIPHEKEREDVEDAVGEYASIIFITTPGQVSRTYIH